MDASSLCSEILRHINISSDIEFAWSKNKGLYGHTAIVLKFNGVPVFTIDYGQEGGYFGSSGTTVSRFNPSAGSSNQALGVSSQVSAVVGALLMPGSDLRVNGFNLSEINTIETIGKFLINSSDKKKIVTDLMVDIAKIKMGEYSALNNNCRHFVEKAIAVINEALNLNGDGSLRGIKQVKGQDKMKIVAGVGAVVLGLFAAVTSQRK